MGTGADDGKAGRHQPMPQVQKKEIVHRNPNHVARDVFDLRGTSNPLAMQLYSDGISSGPLLGIPNRLVRDLQPLSTNARKRCHSDAAFSHHSGDGAGHDGRTTKHGTLQLYRPPVCGEEELKEHFAAVALEGKEVRVPTKRHRSRPGRLDPLKGTLQSSTSGSPSYGENEGNEGREGQKNIGDANNSAPNENVGPIPRFTKLRSNAPNEFTYLVMRPRGIRSPYNPYDLQVVSHRDVDPSHYYTVSAAGVTKFSGHEAEFIELHTWERDCRVFNQLRELDVFREYKKWKSFLLWRGLVRNHAMSNCKTFLTKNLFHVHPQLSAALQTVQRICLNFVNSSRIHPPATETRTLEALCATLAAHLNFQRNRLDKMIKNIRDTVERAAKAAMLAAQIERESISALHAEDEKKKKKLIDVRELGTQQKPTYIEMSQKKAVCQRITAFIRLCDYIIVNCLTKLAATAVEDVDRDFQYPRPDKQQDSVTSPLNKNSWRGKRQEGHKAEAPKPTGPFTGPILSLNVVYREDSQSIEITPSLAHITECVEDVVEDYIKTLSAVPRLLTMDAFKVFTENAAHDSQKEVLSGPAVGEMIVSEEAYKQHMTSVRYGITRAFGDVEEYVNSFQCFRDMYVENSSLDADSIQKRTQNLEFFRERLALYKSQSDAISTKIPSSKDVALFTVYTEELRDFFTPSPVVCLETFHRLLPVIAHQQNELLLADLQSCNTYLAAQPKTVEHYVEYLAYNKALEARFDTLAASYDFVREFFTLLQDEKVEIEEDLEETYRSGTRPQFEKLRTQMQIVEDAKDSQQRYFIRNVDEQLDELRRSIEDVYNRAGQPVIADANADMDEVIHFITDLQAEAERIAAREKKLRQYQIAIGAEETVVETMSDMLNDVNIKARLWVGMREWDEFVESYGPIPFDQLNVQEVQETVQKYVMTVKQVSTKLPGNSAVNKLKSKVEAWRILLPILQALTNPKMKLEHITKVSNAVGPLKDDNGVSKTIADWNNQFTLGMLHSNEVVKFKDEIVAISAAATEEDKLQQQIDKVNALWNGGGPKPPVEFQFHNHKELKDVYVLVGSSVEDVMALLDDSVIAMSSIGSSRCCQGVLRAQVDRWENRLRYMQETLDRWVELQRHWIYLENIFSSAEIRSQWKDDAKRFEKVDRFYRDLMRKAHDMPTAYRGLLINAPVETGEQQNTKTLKYDLEGNIKELEKVLASLERKLEEKRCAFPRFYFLSNDDMLDIFAKVKSPELIMPHMLKMFDGIKTLSFTETNDITHLVSMEGERVELVNKSIKARGPVEVWIDMLEREMFSTLRKHANTCLTDYEQRGDRESWMFQHAVQLVLIMEQLLWTRGVEEALTSENPAEAMSRFKEANYKALESLAGLTARKLSKVQRILLSTLITIDVHGRDLVDEMYESNVLDVKEFGWTKQLRVYWEQDTDGYGNCFIRQNNSRFVYGYEYLGAQGRLVITPLTDRIYMTVTGALKLQLGAAPAGPAGTGKTETVKDLAKNLARQCIVYNCSDGVTYKMMEKFFSGLIQTGAWTCLDEFNRINIEVLSVIASQLFEIKLALQNGLETFTFQGTPNVRVRPTYGAFVTMNPGYAGRTELPDNLKILFRPVAVMTPDFRMIAEVILYSEGFKNAKDLSLKITQLYKLSSEQLSPQDHYDFGMRALKSILVMAGDLKRSQPDVEEDLTLIVACNDSNVPKFVAEDLPLFRGIMQDLFPGVHFPERQYEELLPAMQKSIDGNKLVALDTWVTKGIQFYETLIVRHGVMLVGVTGTGKTEIRTCISEALTSMSEAESSNPMARPVHQFIMNPKSVMMHELYGLLDVNTNEWRDGVLSVIAKNCVRESEVNKDHRWIVFDGPVDTLWVESLNSVLDDSKLLCLDSGERIKLPDTIHMLFEVADLAVASPATVSRCGMVYLDTTDLHWSAVVRHWSESKLAEAGGEPQCREFIVSLFDAHVQKGLDWLAMQKVLISGGMVNVVQSMCDLFTALIKCNNVQLMPDPRCEAKLQHDSKVFKERNELCGILFAFSFVWSIGGNVDVASMDLFDTFVRNLLESVVRFPNSGSVYDYTIDYGTRLFVPWESRMVEFKYDPKIPFFDILVPTVDTMRYSAIANTLIQYGKPLLFNGQTGVGKTVILMDHLSRHKEELMLSVIVFQFSAQTSSERTQELIESKLKQKRKNILGAPPGRKVVLFIDDLNMPALETFGASPPIELLRQVMGNGGFYDRKIAGFWKHVQDVTVVAACGPPEGGRNPITARLTRLFHLLHIPTLSDESMKRVFHSILHGCFQARNFSMEVREMAKPLVAASVDIFNKVRDAMRPKPATPHYTFNLRDLAKVFQGVTQVTQRVCKTRLSITRLWIHEMLRCFFDRLATKEDRQCFTEELMMETMTRLVPGNHVYADYFENKPLVWGDFLRIGASERVYEELPDVSKLPSLFEEYQDDYNTFLTGSGIGASSGGGGEEDEGGSGGGASSLNLVFFKDHCEHLVRIIRILRQPRGNALLVGVGGSGKRSLTRLAAYIAGRQTVEISVGKGYSMNEFHEFLLELYTTTGVNCKPTVFLLSDNQIVHEGMLEDVNSMLNSGEVPSLFTAEEREKRVNACLEAAQQRGFVDRDDVYNFFISRVRDNTHIVLCMSPVGDTFRARCRQFPSLTNCCAIDWFDEWPHEALLGVAQQLFDDEEDGISNELLPVLAPLCVDIHTAVIEVAHEYWEELRRRYYITPTSYLEFIDFYKDLYTTQRKLLEEQLSRVINGKEKMKETDETIAKMRVEIETKRPLLEKASKETEEVVADLSVRQARASEVQVQVRAQQDSAADQQRHASKIANEANARLAEAKPIIDRAKAALDTIQASDLNELRSFANPPSAVLKTAQACMVMFDPKDFGGAWSGNTDWKGAREFLSYRQLLDMIRSYPTDNVKPAILQKMQKYVNDEEFTAEICSQKGSQTCGNLCLWVHAVNEYSKVVKEVAPMREAAAEAERHLSETNAKLLSAQETLRGVEQELVELQKNYEKSLKRKNDLEEGLKVCIRRLENAESLSNSLKSEGARWEENINQLKKRLEALPLQMFMASACAAYFGVFTPRFRKRLVRIWVEKLAQRGFDAADFSLPNTLGDPMDILTWQINGLPTDESSTENAIIASLSTAPRRWPLFIDPQEQGVKWLLQQYATPGTGGGGGGTSPSGVLGSGGAKGLAKPVPSVKVIKLTEPTWMRTLETQIRLGGIVILDDVGETLDPALDPLLSRRIFASEGGVPQIRLTPNTGPIDYNPNFRFFICTKFPNPHYLPDISTRVALLNFTVTIDGLEDQLLGEVVAIEKRELEEEKNHIIQSISLGQKKLKIIEETILGKLKSTQGNILDDSDLIAELKSAQSNAKVLSENQKEANEKMTIITSTRDRYRDVAARASVLFFVLADISRIDPMYQYSLQFFVKLVQNEVRVTGKPDDFSEEDPVVLQAHLEKIVSRLTVATYEQVCRGLFNKDKIILSLLICTAIERHGRRLPDDEWQYLVRASAFVPNELPPLPEELSYLTRQQWELANALFVHVHCFSELGKDLLENGELWKNFILSESPQGAEIPGKWGQTLNPFRRILLIRCFREEKLFFSVIDYVSKAMGQRFVEPPPFNLEVALADSSPTVPIVFILSQGADPMGALQAFAQSQEQKLQYVSLGQGQGENAKRLIASCKKEGDWALLQNCHLSKTFMPELEQQVALLLQSGDTLHPNFRLWLTSMPTDFFPVFVLQNSVKLTNEPPTGLKANMVRCFGEITEEEFNVFSEGQTMGEFSKDFAFKKLLYGLCFFHSVVLERRKFGPLGWNVKYEWNDTDFHVSKQWLRLFFEEQDVIPWESLEYIIGQINYGGRVTDPLDRGTLQTILRRYICPGIMEADFKFSPSGLYYAPDAVRLEGFMDHIQKMSLVDEPEVFGMHTNANLRYQLQVSQYLLNTVTSIQPRLVGGGGAHKGDGDGGNALTPEEEVKRKCEEFEATLPEILTREEAGPRSFTTLESGLPNSMSTVLTHELVKYNKLIQTMRKSLHDLQKALQGLTVLSTDLDAMHESFLTDRVPQLWSAVGYVSLKPLGAWYRDFLARVDFIRTWLRKGEPNSFWIGGLFNPSAFMTGVFQAFSRAEGVSVDKLGFRFEVISREPSEIDEGPLRGCYVHGIHTDSWRWDAASGVMTDSLPGEPYATLPVVHFLPEPHHRTGEGWQRIPLYRTVIRAGVISSLGASSNYVLSIEVPTDKETDYWQLMGAACVCALAV
ncbi:dynein heavy chain, putative [Trypanosoma brucei gambiense DAL972]|uniref:Dynein heavy chain, putative n=1 Tax=Trypanosoma brucei gambiense (strain MHOM/CI/86/DAL972) TaxID=679716 RepID=D0A8Y4_TRYB9|nr:dynein heavy chain, putative [Trypanosoma brucei gambiense DAL972]CBH18135.1 dynein heavy chain, putative [Trypanosoma brucei gambiense DAL972]|eukprot:XP_011780399.1 dynein heavy chain, putative [Trypanosoma brucei gambiense DAL972]